MRILRLLTLTGNLPQLKIILSLLKKALTTAFGSAAEALFTESRNLLLSARTFPEINLLRDQFYQQLERLIVDHNSRTKDQLVWDVNAEICAQLKTDFIELARQHLHFRRSTNGR